MGSVAEREWTLRRVEELAGKSSEYFQAKNQIENLYDQMIQRQNEDCSWLQGRKQLRSKLYIKPQSFKRWIVLLTS